LPNEETVLRRWHQIIGEAIREKRGETPNPVIRKFQKLIDDDPVVRMYRQYHACCSSVMEKIVL